MNFCKYFSHFLSNRLKFAIIGVHIMLLDTSTLRKNQVRADRNLLWAQMKLHLRVYHQTVGYFGSLCTALVTVLLPVKRT